MEGVWATAKKAGTDDDETVYIVQRDAGALRFFRGANIEIPAVIEDVDIANASVTVRYEQDGLTQVLTFQRINADNSVKSDGFGMRLTYGNGRYDELRFVRRLAAADLDVIRRIRERDREIVAKSARLLSTGVDCNSPSGFRADMVCDDFEIREKQEALMSLFDHLSFDYPVDIKSTEAAAWKQLDACKTKACLESGYMQWVRYLETSYEDELLVD